MHADDIVIQINNLAVATGLDPDDVEVTDDDLAIVTVVAPSAVVGDLVWNDKDEDKVKDAGEQGILNAKVKLTNLDTNEVQYKTTDSDGKYLFSALIQGNYKAEIVKSTIDGKLTTSSSYSFFLPDGGSFLTADFGVVQKLPVTGIDAERVAQLGLVMLLLGGLMVFGSRVQRRREH